jgi:CMP-N,N'-diacetyllegionaminic acid synthase
LKNDLRINEDIYMGSSQKILAVIPARGGSKGVPHKNIRLVSNQPLIGYTIQAALAAQQLLYRVIVSTEDEEIARISRDLGAEVPFMRPPELATDTAPTRPVLQHAVDFIEKRDDVQIDWVLLLQPTALFRTAEDIEIAISTALAHECDSVISVTQVFAEHPILMKRIENDQLLSYCIEEKEGTRRQDYSPSAYIRNGAIYLTRRDILMDQDSIWGKIIRPYVMPAERSVNIDSEIDLKVAELLIQERIQS